MADGSGDECEPFARAAQAHRLEDIEMERKSWAAAAAVAFALVALPAPAPAQQGETVIHVVYYNYNVRVRPFPVAADNTEEMTLVLSGKNDVREDFKSSSGRYSQSWHYDVTLGGPRWRMLGPHALRRTIDYPQSTRIDTIEIDRDQCRARWEQRLKPGFAEYTSYSIQLHQIAFYSQMRLVSSTCEIHSR
jgi:hypothetical protein